MSEDPPQYGFNPIRDGNWSEFILTNITSSEHALPGK